MRIIDEKGAELTTYDPAKGWLKNTQKLLQHHEAVEAVEEQGHYETIAEYENGGKDVAWVVDVPGVEAREAWDEFEDVLQFVPFTAEQLADQRIGELKSLLASTDFHILKIIEGATTLQACAEIIKQRAAWRKEMNDLEAKRRESNG